jgi:hypothetical protein
VPVEPWAVGEGHDGILAALCPAGRASCAQPPHKRRPVCGDPVRRPLRGGCTGLAGSTFVVLPLVGDMTLVEDARLRG